MKMWGSSILLFFVGEIHCHLSPVLFFELIIISITITISISIGINRHNKSFSQLIYLFLSKKFVLFSWKI